MAGHAINKSAVGSFIITLMPTYSLKQGILIYIVLMNWMWSGTGTKRSDNGSSEIFSRQTEKLWRPTPQLYKPVHTLLLLAIELFSCRQLVAFEAFDGAIRGVVISIPKAMFCFRWFTARGFQLCTMIPIRILIWLRTSYCIIFNYNLDCKLRHVPAWNYRGQGESQGHVLIKNNSKKNSSYSYSAKHGIICERNYHLTSAQRRICLNFLPFHNCLLRVWVILWLSSMLDTDLPRFTDREWRVSLLITLFRGGITHSAFQTTYNWSDKSIEFSQNMSYWISVLNKYLAASIK